MRDQFVSLDIALELEKIGFDEPCMASIRKRDGKFMPHIGDGYKIKGISNSELTKIKVILALPLWQQANDWLKKEKKVMVCDLWDGWEAGKEDADNFTYFETKEAAFKHAIKII